jgi:hypothetical protein
MPEAEAKTISTANFDAQMHLVGCYGTGTCIYVAEVSDMIETARSEDEKLSMIESHMEDVDLGLLYTCRDVVVCSHDS